MGGERNTPAQPLQDCILSNTDTGPIVPHCPHPLPTGEEGGPSWSPQRRRKPQLALRPALATLARTPTRDATGPTGASGPPSVQGYRPLSSQASRGNTGGTWYSPERRQDGDKERLPGEGGI